MKNDDVVLGHVSPKQVDIRSLRLHRDNANIARLRREPERCHSDVCSQVDHSGAVAQWERSLVHMLQEDLVEREEIAAVLAKVDGPLPTLGGDSNGAG